MTDHTFTPAQASGDSNAVLWAAYEAFEFIRLKLIDHLNEPERTAFWKAVEGRRAVGNFLAAQPPAAPVEIGPFPGEDDSGNIGIAPRPRLSAGNVEAALRDAFPHFQEGSPITPEAIRGIGKEYLDMIMNWEPHKDEIEFADHNGTIRKIVYEPGDYEVGINPGWILEDDTLDEPQEARVEGATDIVDEAACLIWAELCPGMIMGDEDRPHYENAAKAVLALSRPK